MPPRRRCRPVAQSASGVSLTTADRMRRAGNRPIGAVDAGEPMIVGTGRGDAVDPDAIPELASLHRRNPGERIDGRLVAGRSRCQGTRWLRPLEAVLMTAPPLPAAPPGRIARNACLVPRAVPSTLTESIRKVSAASRSATSWVISIPALLTRMSKPPIAAIASSTAIAQLSSSVTSRWTNAALVPLSESVFALAVPSSSSRSAITTDAPESAKA